MHSHSELTTDKLLKTRLLVNNILCIPPSQLPTTSSHMTSFPAMFNYGLSHLDSSGEENKKQKSIQPATQHHVFARKEKRILKKTKKNKKHLKINSDLVSKMSLFLIFTLGNSYQTGSGLLES